MPPPLSTRLCPLTPRDEDLPLCTEEGWNPPSPKPMMGAGLRFTPGGSPVSWPQ